ncbi:uncharacterized protein LOC21401800 [Morus notabilis]|uniref:uncharacterized protein LOC21401800 n=1 Tax=Morus notabilis TaxID=981085 RepID=UPI000CED7EF5|nr:uncharacterized protein LOC21401800 [Morus notabilis]XP_024026836.1 uncharacterized protein LOC21401800 [Morus notabilis]XP_024026838.1 uncharacterized protein LOC21401800 [Morus notabilis]XP_024026839.1 uncharacterized protein LOC21401800 [Morus notabilis]
MWTEKLLRCQSPPIPSPILHCHSHPISKHRSLQPPRTRTSTTPSLTTCRRRLWTISASSLSQPQPLDLTEDNIRLVLADARLELSQLFDDSVGITGQVQLAELDGPFVKISLKGRFWHKRSTVLARLGNYLKQRIPEILEVDIEDEKQLDDSPANF